ncbi:MAG: hypothetical protein ABI353_08960 [Isosphaeraceae bacterium]
MQYRYLQTRGALNDAGSSALAGRASRSGTTANWRGQQVPSWLLDLMPESLVREELAVPIAAEGERVVFAVIDVGDIALADKLSFVLAREVRLISASASEISAFIDQVYGPAGPETESVDSMLQDFTPDADDVDMGLSTAPSAPPPSPRAGREWRARSQELSLAQTRRSGSPGFDPVSGLDLIRPLGELGVLTYVVEEGQRVLMRRPNGSIVIVAGPKRLWRGWNTFQAMFHHVAHPGEYLIVRYRDGRQDHLPGPADLWFDPRIHQDVAREDALQVAAKEAVVVYSSKDGGAAVQRRIEHGPTLFTPRPGEWLHTFSWHASKGGSQGLRKVAHGLVFQKLWLMPDQMYHDVADVRTADDAVLTIRLMIFFELLDIERMLESSHDPIGDFVNAATSDVVDFTGRHDFESFKQNTDRLNELETYRQLVGRAGQCGYRINKVVYRGYGAPTRLQQMHDQAIEARTKLQLERATEQQSQDLEDDRLDSQLARATKRRREQASEVEHDLALGVKKQEAGLRNQEAKRVFLREQDRLEAEQQERFQGQQDERQRAHFAALREMGVDLTAYLTQGRADRVIELRGSNGSAHVHLDPARHPRNES